MNRIILTVALAIATLPTVFTACATEVVKEIPVEVVIEKEIVKTIEVPVVETIVKDLDPGELVLYSGRSESLVGNIVEQFEEVTGIDVIITLCGLYNQDEVLNHVLEFVGESVTSLSIDERLTIANMTTECGALAGVFPIDDGTIKWLRNRAKFIAYRGLENVPSDADGKNGDHVKRLGQG